MKRFFIVVFVLGGGGVFLSEPIFCQESGNPFLRPGVKRPAPPPVVKPAPPPPAPIPRNSNLEFRGYFKFENEWYFAIFDKAKNEGAWLKKGESFDDGKVQVIGFDANSDEVRLKGGMTLALKSPDHKVLSVPSGLPIKSTQPSKSPPVPRPNAQSIPPPRRR